MKRLFLLALFVVSILPLAHGQDITYNASFVAPRADKGLKLPTNTYYSQWKLSWVAQGTLSTCTVQVDTSQDGANWTSQGLFGLNACTSGLPSVYTNGVGSKTNPIAYIRINVISLSGAQNSGDIGLNVTVNGWSSAF